MMACALAVVAAACSFRPAGGGPRTAALRVASGARVLVFSPQGKLLGRLNTGERTANCTFGDDGSTLYVTADMYLCKVKTMVKGLGY